MWDWRQGPSTLRPLPEEVLLDTAQHVPHCGRLCTRGRYPPLPEPWSSGSEPTAVAGVPTQKGAFAQPGRLSATVASVLENWRLRSCLLSPL